MFFISFSLCFLFSSNLFKIYSILFRLFSKILSKFSFGLSLFKILQLYICIMFSFSQQIHCALFSFSDVKFEGISIMLFLISKIFLLSSIDIFSFGRRYSDILMLDLENGFEILQSWIRNIQKDWVFFLIIPHEKPQKINESYFIFFKQKWAMIFCIITGSK